MLWQHFHSSLFYAQSHVVHVWLLLLLCLPLLRKDITFIVTGHTALLLCYIHIHLFVSLWHLLLCFDISLMRHFLTCFMLTYHCYLLRSVTYLLFCFVYQSHWFVLTYFLYPFRRFNAYIATPYLCSFLIYVTSLRRCVSSWHSPCSTLIFDVCQHWQIPLLTADTGSIVTMFYLAQLRHYLGIKGHLYIVVLRF
jgi:hypothetical protein